METSFQYLSQKKEFLPVASLPVAMGNINVVNLTQNCLFSDKFLL